MKLVYEAQGLYVKRRYVSEVNLGTTYSQTRGAVVLFSRRSGTRMCRYLSSCVAEYKYIGTLTYPGFDESVGYPDWMVDGKLVKEHLASFIREYKRKVFEGLHRDEEKTFSFFWFLEFQERGAPHFHYFTTHVPHIRERESLTVGEINKKIRDIIARLWNRIVAPNDEAHYKAGTQFDVLRSKRGGSISYAAKYARKQAQKRVPCGYENCGRFWGVSGLRAVVAASLVFAARHARSEAVKKLEERLAKLIKATAVAHNCKIFGAENGEKWRTIKLKPEIVDLVQGFIHDSAHELQKICKKSEGMLPFYVWEDPEDTEDDEFFQLPEKEAIWFWALKSVGWSYIGDRVDLSQEYSRRATLRE